MLYTTKRGESFDTDKDFSAPERHILQKLFIWKDFAANVEEFRSKKEEALRKGWNDSSVQEDWFRFHEQAFIKIIKEWLEDNGVAATIVPLNP